MSDERVFLVRLPISGAEADCIGMPAEWFERAVRYLGREQSPSDVAASGEPAQLRRKE